ncbi:MAG: hypothetical protein P3M72_00100 [Candidatus Hodgkinia cicadicola]|nr:MAG: hypothetical protein P3M72_00100 [Candidatus Hodgkinia cicadicola]
MQQTKGKNNQNKRLLKLIRGPGVHSRNADTAKRVDATKSELANKYLLGRGPKKAALNNTCFGSYIVVKAAGAGATTQIPKSTSLT